jgi:mono/diheme cytochrome c family protein
MVGYRCVNVASTAPNILSLGLLLVVTFVAASDGAAQTSASVARERSGEELFQSGCAACHGVNGRGGVREQIGFDDPLPDFTACDFATPEPDSDWLAIVHQGGPVRAFSRRMPAFRDLLSDAEIERVVDYLRGFCRDPAWPRGDLNLPRPLVTEKAFPENEALFTTSGQGGDAPALGSSFIYERRLGRRSQYEVQVPIDAQKSNATWTGGLGDITLAFKHVIHADLAGGRILSAGAELLLPTGSESRSLGKGTTIVEPFLAFGQLLPADAFVEAHTGIELPADTEKSSRELFFSAAIGKSYTQDSWGRSWSPMVEFVAAREMTDGEPLLWDAVPQLQVTLSRRQHIMISGGVRTPINRRSGRDTQLVGYFLWDWFDGGLFEGWK